MRFNKKSINEKHRIAPVVSVVFFSCSSMVSLQQGPVSMMAGSRNDQGEIDIARWLCDRISVVGLEGRMAGWMDGWMDGAYAADTGCGIADCL